MITSNVCPFSKPVLDVMFNTRNEDRIVHDHVVMFVSIQTRTRQFEHKNW